jgi:hypothetical protein
MKRIVLACAVCTVVCTSMIAKKNSYSASVKSTVTTTLASAVNNVEAVNYWIGSLFEKMNLGEMGLDSTVFYNACKGYEYMLSQNAISKPGILTICDFSQNSSKKRLYVLDLNNAKILFNTYVSHGRNSGNDYATSFSNSNDSHKSSLGFMRTAETYVGENGYSMRLDGMENGFNNNVRARAIVMHGSDYVNARRASQGTMMGRSYGCPAVPAAEVSKIINCIKGGTCFFSYYPDKLYTKASKILNADFVWPVAQSLQLAAAKTPDTLAKMITAADQVN